MSAKIFVLFHFKKRRGKAKNFTTLFIDLPCWNVNPWLIQRLKKCWIENPSLFTCVKTIQNSAYVIVCIGLF